MSGPAQVKSQRGACSLLMVMDHDFSLHDRKHPLGMQQLLLNAEGCELKECAVTNPGLVCLNASDKVSCKTKADTPSGR